MQRESYGAYPAVTAAAVEHRPVTLAIRAAKQKAAAPASLTLSILISPTLHIQMAALLSRKRPKKPMQGGFMGDHFLSKYEIKELRLHLQYSSWRPTFMICFLRGSYPIPVFTWFRPDATCIFG